MSDLTQAEREISRRRFLAAGGALVAAGTFGSLLDPLAALGATKWPAGVLGAGDATRVKESQFMPVSQFVEWNKALDKVGPSNQRGLRATGSAAHEAYTDQLRNDLERAGVKQLTLEPVSMQRWTTDTWSLDLLDGTAAGPVKTASYMPYSGKTPAGGVTGPLVFVARGSTPAPGSLAGKIAVFDVPITILPKNGFNALAYKNGSIDPRGELTTAPYKRPFFGIGGTEAAHQACQAAGAVGAVAVMDLPFDGTLGSYFPYVGIIRDCPAVFVDRATGAALKQQAAAGTQARVTLPATIAKVKTRNLLGFIPGQSREIVTLHCHTDGSNAIEDNGPGAIVAMSQYLTRLPKKALPRTIMILLTTGHFAGGNGSRAFLARHKDDLVKRTNAAITIEHLGVREWEELPSGRMGPTGHYEPGGMFMPGSQALVDASIAALKRGKGTPSIALKPLFPNNPGTPDKPVWPGEGQYLYGVGRIPDANYIAGPSYLLNWGIKTVDKCDHKQVRAEAIAFTEMILRLGRTPRKQLRTFTLS